MRKRYSDIYSSRHNRRVAAAQAPTPPMPSQDNLCTASVTSDSMAGTTTTASTAASSSLAPAQPKKTRHNQRNVISSASWRIYLFLLVRSLQQSECSDAVATALTAWVSQLCSKFRTASNSFALPATFACAQRSCSARLQSPFGVVSV